MSFNKGYRKQLQDRLVEKGIEALSDYEIVELLLGLGTPGRDCKLQAKEAIAKFGTLRKVMEAGSEQLNEIKGAGKENYFGIKFVKEVAGKYLKEGILLKEVLKSSREVHEYLCHSMRDLNKEIFKVIFLDGQNRILTIEDLSEGTLASSAVYPREIVKAAIKHNSAGMIFAHNHPSGNPNPSEDDKQITKTLVIAGRIMQIKVLDHIIVGNNKFYSFADEGFIERYNDESKISEF